MEFLLVFFSFFQAYIIDVQRALSWISRGRCARGWWRSNSLFRRWWVCEWWQHLGLSRWDCLLIRIIWFVGCRRAVAESFIFIISHPWDIHYNFSKKNTLHSKKKLYSRKNTPLSKKIFSRTTGLQDIDIDMVLSVFLSKLSNEQRFVLPPRTGTVNKRWAEPAYAIIPCAYGSILPYLYASIFPCSHTNISLLINSYFSTHMNVCISIICVYFPTHMHIALSIHINNLWFMCIYISIICMNFPTHMHTALCICIYIPIFTCIRVYFHIHTHLYTHYISLFIRIYTPIICMMVYFPHHMRLALILCICIPVFICAYFHIHTHLCTQYFSLSIRIYPPCISLITWACPIHMHLYSSIHMRLSPYSYASFSLLGFNSSSWHQHSEAYKWGVPAIKVSRHKSPSRVFWVSLQPFNSSHGTSTPRKSSAFTRVPPRVSLDTRVPQESFESEFLKSLDKRVSDLEASWIWGFDPIYTLLFDLQLQTNWRSDFHPFKWAGVDIYWFSVNGLDTRWIPRSMSCSWSL